MANALGMAVKKKRDVENAADARQPGDAAEDRIRIKPANKG